MVLSVRQNSRGMVGEHTKSWFPAAYRSDMYRFTRVHGVETYSSVEASVLQLRCLQDIRYSLASTLMPLCPLSFILFLAVAPRKRREPVTAPTWPTCRNCFRTPDGIHPRATRDSRVSETSAHPHYSFFFAFVYGFTSIQHYVLTQTSSTKYCRVYGMLDTAIARPNLDAWLDTIQLF